jgi:hypothetical protein
MPCPTNCKYILATSLVFSAFAKLVRPHLLEIRQKKKIKNYDVSVTCNDVIFLASFKQTTDFIHNFFPGGFTQRAASPTSFPLSETHLTSQTESKEDYHGSRSSERDTC